MSRRRLQCPVSLFIAILISGQGVAADSSEYMDVPPCASLIADCGYTAALIEAGNLSNAALSVFSAVPAYSISVNGQAKAVNIGSKPRYFDFSGERAFVNPATGVSDIAAINAASDSATALILGGDRITNVGIPGRVFKHDGRTIIRYVAGDPPVAGKCRSQMATYPVPARQRLLFDFALQFGESAEGHEWHLTPPGDSPAVIWQMKAPEVQPSLAVVVDTDPARPDGLLLSFSRKSAFASTALRVGNLIRIKRNQPLRMLMDAYLDEREIGAGGRGYWRVWINGKQILDTFGPTLSAVAQEPHQWFLSLYLYNNAQPLPFNRSVIWKRARMLQISK